MKAYVITQSEGGGKGQEAASSNRQFYVKNISEGITEIIRYTSLILLLSATACPIIIAVLFQIAPIGFHGPRIPV